MWLQAREKFPEKTRQNKNKNMNKWKKTRVHRMSNLFSWNHGLKLNYFTPFSSLRHFSFLWNKTSKWRGTKIELYNAQTHACNVEKKSNGNSFGTSDNCFQPNTPRAEGMRVPLDVCYKIPLLYLLNACICCKVCSILLFLFLFFLLRLPHYVRSRKCVLFSGVKSNSMGWCCCVLYATASIAHFEMNIIHCALFWC